MDVSHISVNAQSSIRIQGSLTLRFDPFRIEDEPHDADVILITHSHYDHLSGEDIARVIHDGSVFVVPRGMEGELEGLARTCPVHALAPGEAADLAGMRIEAVPAYNLAKSFHPRENGWVGYVVDVDGLRVYVAGDTDDVPENRSLEVDVALIPIGGTYTMDAREAAAFANAIAPSVAIPTHYGSIVGSPEDGRLFAELVDDGIQVELPLG